MNKEQSDKILSLMSIDDEKAMKAVDDIVNETMEILPEDVKPYLRKAQDYHRDNPLSEAVLTGLAKFTDDQINTFIEVYTTANRIIDARADHLESLLMDASEAYVKSLLDNGVDNTETAVKVTQTLH